MKNFLLLSISCICFLSSCTEPNRIITQTFLEPSPVATSEKRRPDLQVDYPSSWEWLNSDKVFFDYDKSDLTPKSKETLLKWVSFLNKYSSDTFVIEGHTDERGTREYNLALGERRAFAVKKFLIANGIRADRLKTISYGKDRPWVVETGEFAWEKNRRVVGFPDGPPK